MVPDGHKVEACMFEQVKTKKESLQPEDVVPELVDLKDGCTPAPLSRWQRVYLMTCGGMQKRTYQTGAMMLWLLVRGL